MVETTSSNTTTPKKRTVRRKTAVPPETLPFPTLQVETKNTTTVTQGFKDLSEKISTAQEEFETLLKQISETRELWLKEQKDYERQKLQKRQEDELDRKREQELHDYETSLKHKKEEDEFASRKVRWERELTERKDELKSQTEELEALRKEVTGFESAKEKAVKEATTVLEKNLRKDFVTERELKDVQEKSAKEILSLKIQSLSLENSRQAKEIDSLKSRLDEVTRQFKELAVKVVEGRNPLPPQSPKAE